MKKSLQQQADKKRRNFFLSPLVIIPVSIAITLMSIGVVAVMTNYQGKIHLKFSPDGGELQINPSEHRW
jgi:hypothetical protein